MDFVFCHQKPLIKLRIMLYHKSLFFVLAILFSIALNAQTSFWVGTYTKDKSKGIYQYSIDKNGKLSFIQLAATIPNPSFIAFSDNGRFLVSVREIANDNNSGEIQLYRVDKNNQLNPINNVSSGGAHPCFVDIKDNHVVAANYTGGNIGLIQFNGKQLSQPTDVAQHKGSGPNKSRQEKPHAHSAFFAPKSDLVFAVDLGIDAVKVYRTNKNKLQSYAEIKMAPGAGPRHLDFHPKADFIYVVNELSSSVSVVKHSNYSNFEIIQTTSTLPANFKAENTCADIHVSSDGRFLYASNRGDDSIALFEILKNGKLKAIGHESTRGKTPRNFSLSPDEKFLLVANQNTNNIVSFKRDRKTGQLTFVDEVKAPIPVCIRFKRR
ncbi:lactonase family protein [Prolixibacteraceae bacterium JC049]|nr:lactonase family protein [Prolixibacteraceae bacterium JC049]